MAEIPCEDFYNDAPPVVPTRIKCTEEQCIPNRWANFVGSMALSPEQGDEEVGQATVAWSIWDLQASLATQIDQPFGDDLICVAINNRIYYIDWDSNVDEWLPNVATPLYRLAEIGPIPAAPLAASDEVRYVDNVLKRFRAFWWIFKDEPTDDASRVRITVAQWDNEELRRRQGTYKTQRTVKVKQALAAPSFTVKIEHGSDEKFAIRAYEAEWDMVGSRTRNLRRRG